MKKTLAAVAVLGAFAGSALAADVQLYGIVDTGLRYLHSDSDKIGADATDKFSMESGMQSGSRFGLKGTEDLGNGLTVGFILESQFSADTGALSDDDHFFRREASLFLEGGFGKVAMGRMGSFNGGVSSWSKHGVMSAFGTSWGGYTANADNTFGNSGIWDNVVAYETPSFAGFKVFAMYGMGNQVTESYDKTIGTGPDTIEDEATYGVENESSSDRYYAIGASYANGPLNLLLTVDSINYSSAHVVNGDGDIGYQDMDDAWTVRFGGNYDFEVVKLYAGAAYFDEAKLNTFSGMAKDEFGASTKIKGWSLGVSAGVPLAGGTGLFGVSYLSAEAADSITDGDKNADFDLDRWIVSAGYDYPLSKRTNVYGVVTYNLDSMDYSAKDTDKVYDRDPSVFGVMVGLRHKF